MAAADVRHQGSTLEASRNFGVEGRNPLFGEMSGVAGPEELLDALEEFVMVFVPPESLAAREALLHPVQLTAGRDLHLEPPR